MQMYLSSYNLGDQVEELRQMVPENNKLGYIFSALDFTGADPERRAARVEQNMNELNELGFDCFELDLKKYFGKQEGLRQLINSLGAIWVSGGNVFLLRQAYKLSGFDEILLELYQNNTEILYGGYSAGVCIPSPTLKAYQIVDDATNLPYEEQDEVIMEGLGILDYVYLPHFESDHPESAAIGEELKYCQDNNLLYQTARDGEVMVIKQVS